MSWKTLPPTIGTLRRELVSDSIDRGRKMEKLLRLVRADERAKTLEAMAQARDHAERVTGR